MGRKLSFNEVVHHVDEDIYNNDLSNLELVHRSKHLLLHPEIRERSLEARTKYFIDKGFLNEMFSIKRITVKEISKLTGIPDRLIFYYIKKHDIKRADIFCECGTKLKYSKTMMCTICRTRHNRRIAKCQK